MSAWTAFSALGQPGGSSPWDPYVGYNFYLQMEGLIVGGFKQVSGLSASIAHEEYREGGRNTTGVHLVGGTTWSPITLHHGMIELDGLWMWFEAASRGVVRKRHCTLMMLDERSIPKAIWNIFDAMPVRWTGPELDATTGGVAMESIELVHSGMKKPMLAQMASAGLGIADMIG